jgi:hypothetical protein
MGTLSEYKALKTHAKGVIYFIVPGDGTDA